MGEVINHPVVDAGYTHLPPGVAERAASAALDQLNVQTSQQNRKREWIAAGIGVCALGACTWGLHDFYEMGLAIFTHTAPKNGFGTAELLPLGIKLNSALVALVVIDRIKPKQRPRVKKTISFGSRVYRADND